MSTPDGTDAASALVCFLCDAPATHLDLRERHGEARCVKCAARESGESAGQANAALIMLHNAVLLAADAGMTGQQIRDSLEWSLQAARPPFDLPDDRILLPEWALPGSFEDDTRYVPLTSGEEIR